VDIYAGELHVYSPDEGRDIILDTGEALGCVAPTRDRQIVLAHKGGFARLEGYDKLVPLADPEAHLPGNRYNDGKCDPAGRFLAGTMDNAEVEASGSLYSLAPDGTLKTLLSDLRISNGLAWSPDQHTFYHIDTPTRTVMAYDYDLATGDIDQPRPVILVPPALGWPDGMTSDSEGKLWVALWGPAGNHPLPGVEHQFVRLRRTGPVRPVHHLGPQRHRRGRAGGASIFWWIVPGADQDPRNADVCLRWIGRV
jgi:sugar lactone lactonase YvrE